MTKFSARHIAVLTLGFSFLYLPILILIIFSFNDSRLVTVWGGFSTQWYSSLFQNQQLLDAAKASLSIAFYAATGATILGLLIAQTLARKSFRGKTLYTGLSLSPLVLPEVVTGLSLLLLFVAVDWERGFWTVTIAHITFTSAFAAVIIHAQLSTLDRSIEEAALNLGCRPFKTFLVITIPMIMPSILAAWLLCFTLSLDDLVIASFTSGPGATTLPMRIYSQVRLGVSPEINALSTLLIAFVTLLVVSMSLLLKGRILLQNKKTKS